MNPKLGENSDGSKANVLARIQALPRKLMRALGLDPQPNVLASFQGEALTGGLPQHKMRIEENPIDLTRIPLQRSTDTSGIDLDAQLAKMGEKFLEETLQLRRKSRKFMDFFTYPQIEIESVKTLIHESAQKNEGKKYLSINAPEIGSIIHATDGYVAVIRYKVGWEVLNSGDRGIVKGSARIIFIPKDTGFRSFRNGDNLAVANHGGKAEIFDTKTQTSG